MSDKMAKPAAKYRPSPKGKESCNKCSMFRPMNQCTAVEGDISPFGWCKLWEKK